MVDVLTAGVELVKTVLDTNLINVNLVGVEFGTTIGAAVGLAVFYKVIWKPYLSEWLSGVRETVGKWFNKN